MSEPNDKLLDEYLRRESPVSQRYREIEAQDVPPQLDAAVLAQARAAVANRAKRKPAWVKWGAPLALAASAVMAVAIVFEIGVQEEVRMPAPQTERTTAERAQDARVVEEVTASAPAEVSYTAQEPQADATAQKQTQQVDAFGYEQRQQAEASARKQMQQAEASVRELRQAPIESVTTERPRVRQPEPQASVAAPVSVLSDDVVERLDAPSDSNTRPAATPRAAVAPESAELPAPEAKLGRRASMTSTLPAAAEEQAPRLPAEEWLERIRTLRREGKVIEADEQWREFRATYPDFEVSETDSARPEAVTQP